MTPQPTLSLVIPAHNEEKRLPLTLEKVLSYLDGQPYSAEVLIVENGSQDQTIPIAQSFASRHPQVRLICETARGKGLAVRRGMLEARGAYRFMCDADLSMPITELARFLPPALNDFDIAVASREAPGAVRYGEPSYRHIGGRLINLLVRLCAVRGLHDTQCGFKCFRAAVAEDLFHHQTLTGMSFDIEILYLAQRRGYRIVELPIPWYFDPDSRVRLLGDTLRILLDILQIQRNARRGLYDAAPEIRP